MGRKLSRRRLAFFVGVLVLLAALAAAGNFPQRGDHYGFWSVLPPAVAIILAFATREVISSLFIGIALVVLPGPAFIVIPIALAILAGEFVWARSLLNRVKKEIVRRTTTSDEG